MRCGRTIGCGFSQDSAKPPPWAIGCHPVGIHLVARLHGQGARRSPDFRGELDDLRVVAVQPAEPGAHVEAKREEELIAGPIGAGGHGMLRSRAS